MIKNLKFNWNLPLQIFIGMEKRKRKWFAKEARGLINLTLEKIAPFFTLEVEENLEEGKTEISISLQNKKN